MTDWPRYRCHKYVEALLIAEVNVDAASIVWMVPDNRSFPEFSVDSDFVMKHRPEPGGYFLRYDDGYESWSPADPFEAGYTIVASC